jgi:hypothetical protein
MYATHRYIAAPTKLSVTTTTARTTAGLAVGQYRMTAIGGNVYFRRGNSSVEATVSHTPLADGTSILFTVASGDANSHVAAITASGTATLFFDRLE